MMRQFEHVLKWHRSSSEVLNSQLRLTLLPLLLLLLQDSWLLLFHSRTSGSHTYGRIWNKVAKTVAQAGVCQTRDAGVAKTVRVGAVDCVRWSLIVFSARWFGSLETFTMILFRETF
jgi:hypothetical protein